MGMTMPGGGTIGRLRRTGAEYFEERLAGCLIEGDGGGRHRIPERVQEDMGRGDGGTGSSPLALFCARLKRLQQAAGITQASLAAAAHLGTSQMSDILNGKIRQPPDWDVIASVIRACVRHAESNGRAVPADLLDEAAWRHRHADLEQDLETGGRRRRETFSGTDVSYPAARAAYLEQVRTVPPVTQSAQAGRDAFTAGRDVTVNKTVANYGSMASGSVPVAAAVRDAGLVFSAARVAEFTGREWLLDSIDQFIKTTASGYVLVEAEAGMGKTAFAAWLARERGYVSHFSRYSGGRSVRAALENLSAQLIIRFGLDDLAPGGMLPEWVQTPGGFERILSQAAALARESGVPLVLVVDGLEEAEHDGDGLPFGLPLLLPDGMHVICTYRTGTPLSTPEVPLLPLRISKDDPRNLSDIRAFLAAAAHGELASRLAEAGTSPASFTDLLARRCEGVWVYLRYVLEELRLGLRSADAIGDLPAGLRGYYADQVRRWQRDPSWEDCLLPLLATLGVAGEPLPAATLAALAGDLDIRAVRRLCDWTLRPLLGTTRSEIRSPVRYEVYHASFRQVLKAEHTEPASSPGAIRYDLEALADQLGEATGQAHSRIADIYLSRFGGLAHGLPYLAAEPRSAGADDGYPLRHLARHLHHGGRTSDLHKLLAASQQKSGGQAINLWYAAHDAAECVSSYLDDLSRAQHIAATATDQALARSRPAPSLGLEIRYALMAASIRSRATLISPELLGLLLRTGQWSSERSLDHARRLTDPAKRLAALMAIHALATSQAQPAIMAEALGAAIAISSDDDARARALARLAPHLSSDQLTRALDVAAVISSDDARAEALAGLAPYLPSDQQPAGLARALDAATNISIDYARAEALVALTPRLSSDQLFRALDAAIAISSDYFRAEVLAGLAPRLSFDQLIRALDAAIAISDVSARARALTELAPHLPPDQQSTILARGLDAATAISDDGTRARALAALAPHLPSDQQSTILARALDAATAISDDYFRARALTELAPHLRIDQQSAILARALDAAAAIGSNYTRTDALTAIACHLPADQQSAILARALDAATAIGDDSFRLQALAALAFHLPADQRSIILARALDAATAVSDDSRAEALAAIASRLSSDQLTRALDAAIAISSDYFRAEVLAGLGPYLSSDQLTRALDAAIAIVGDDARARALAALAPQLPSDQQPVILARALDAAIAIVGDDARARALAALGPYLSSDQLTRALDAAIAIVGDDARARALAALAPQLPADQQPAILTRTLDAAIAVSSDRFAVTAFISERIRAEALAAIASRLSSDQLTRALDAAIPVSSDYFRAEVLAGLGPYLSSDQLTRALDAAIAISDEYLRARALVYLASRLSSDQLTHALDAAVAISDDYSRAEPLAAIACHLPSDQQPAIFTRALDAAVAISDEPFRAEALAAIACHLPSDQQPAIIACALDAAAAISDEDFRVEVLVGLAPRLSSDQLIRALDAAPQDTDTLLAILARGESFLAEDASILMGLLRGSLRRSERYTCLSIIAGTASSLNGLGGTHAMIECASAILDTAQWWQ
jgi:transcriptional regulator with XRE-family HTH domain